MEVTKTALPGSKLELRLNMSADDVDQAFGKVYQEVSDQGGIPGFRPGKAPAKVIRRRVGEDVVREMAWMRLIEDQYPAMLEEHEIEPIDDPSFPDLEDLGLEEGGPVEFTITLTVRPTPNIRQYKGLKVLKPSSEVTDEQVDESLAELQEGAAELSETERDTVAEGDAVSALFRVVPEGEEEPDEPSEQEFIIGSGRYEPAIDMEMIGKKVGDKVSLEHEYPEDYQSALVAGQKVTVTAEIVSIMERTLPEINDEFAASQGEFETLDDLKETIREQLARQMQDQAGAEAEQNALAALMAHTTVELPEALVDQMAAGNFEQFATNLERDGLTVDSFTEIAQLSEEQIRANERLRAEAALKLHFALDQVRREEDIELDDEDMDAEMARFAASAGTDLDFIRQAMEIQEGFEDQFRERAMRNKIVSVIVDSSEVEEVARDEYEAAREAERERLTEVAEQLAAEEAPEEEAPEEPDAADAAKDTSQPAEQDDEAATAAPKEAATDTEQTDADTGDDAEDADTSDADTPNEADASDTEAGQ